MSRRQWTEVVLGSQIPPLSPLVHSFFPLPRCRPAHYKGAVYRGILACAVDVRFTYWCAWCVPSSFWHFSVLVAMYPADQSRMVVLLLGLSWPQAWFQSFQFKCSWLLSLIAPTASPVRCCHGHLSLSKRQMSGSVVSIINGHPQRFTIANHSADFL